MKWPDKFERAEKKWASWQMQSYAQNERTLPSIIENKALIKPQHIVFQFADNEISFLQLHHSCQRTAQGFKNLGVSSKDNVALMLPNNEEHIYSWIGLNTLGAVDVPINIAQRGDGLAYQLNQSDCVGLVVHQDYLPVIEKIISKLTLLRFIVVVQTPSSESLPSWASPKKCLSFECLTQQTGVIAPKASFNSLSSILYTSGTTGPSKGVMISHHYWYKAAEAFIHFSRITEDDVLYTAMPFFHSAARGMTILPAILSDSKAVFSDRFSASNMLADVRRWNCTVSNYIGGMISIMMKQDEKIDDANNPLRLMVGGAAPEQLWQPFQDRFNTTILELYGLTECLFSLVNPYEQRKAGACGKPITGYRVKLVDDNDNEVETGTTGEIIIQPEAMFLGTTGYYKMAEKTLELKQNFWVHTGDLARQDDEGYFYYVDRKKQTIRRRGENISSFEVEAVINSHDAVLESCAVGVPSELGEEDVKAVVVLKPGTYLDEADLITWCKERMAYFAVPRYIAYREQLPKTASDRVEKYRLKKEGITSDCWDVEKFN